MPHERNLPQWLTTKRNHDLTTHRIKRLDLIPIRRNRDEYQIAIHSHIGNQRIMIAYASVRTMLIAATSNNPCAILMRLAFLSLTLS